jgi:hypothetical protein
LPEVRPHADAPADAQDHAVVTQGTVRKDRAESPRLVKVNSQLDVRLDAFEVVDGHVFVPFALGVPEDRELHGADFLGINAVHAKLAGQDFAWAVLSRMVVKRQGQAWLHHVAGFPLLPGLTTI